MKVHPLTHDKWIGNWMLKHWVLEGLEALHRASWRSYAVGILFLFSFIGMFGVSAFADNKKVTDKDLMAFLNGESSSKDKAPVMEQVKKTAPEKKEEAPQSSDVAAPSHDGAKAEDEKVEQEEVSGKISAVNKMGIAVEYEHTKQSANEMYLPFGGKVKLNRIESLGKLKMGDVVKVYYERVYKMDPKKKEKIILKTTATAVDFVKPAPQGLQSLEEDI